jgi:hypothetical protein
MNPVKVTREKTIKLTDLPNIGPAMAKDLKSIGIDKPDDLKGKEAFDLYKKLCEKKGLKVDPCVLDVFMSITDFIKDNKPKVWWEYTKERKKT